MSWDGVELEDFEGDLIIEALEYRLDQLYGRDDYLTEREQLTNLLFKMKGIIIS